MFLNFQPYAYDGAILNYTIFAGSDTVPGDYEHTVQVTDADRGISRNFTVRITVTD